MKLKVVLGFLIILSQSCVDKKNNSISKSKNTEKVISSSSIERKSELKKNEKHFTNSNKYKTLKIYKDASNMKSLADILIDNKISEDSLQLLSTQIKSDLKLSCKKNFIRFYLKKNFSEVGVDFWAKAYVNETTNVEILGLSKNEEQKIVKKLNRNPDQIGSWIDDSPYVGGIFTLYKRNNKYFIDRINTDDKKETHELRKEGRNKYYFVRGANAREKGYYEIKSNGNLECYDRLGLIFTSRPYQIN